MVEDRPPFWPVARVMAPLAPNIWLYTKIWPMSYAIACEHERAGKVMVVVVMVMMMMMMVLMVPYRLVLDRHSTVGAERGLRKKT